MNVHSVNNGLMQPKWASISSLNGKASQGTFASAANYCGDAGQLDGDALISGSIRMSGTSWLNASAYKADDYSDDNPIMRVVGKDVCGAPFEKFVKIKDVDPRSASFIELFALDGYNAATGERVGSFARAASAGMQSQAIANGGSGEDWGAEINGFTKFNMVSSVFHLMKLQQQYGNFEASMHLQGIYDSMNMHIKRYGL